MTTDPPWGPSELHDIFLRMAEGAERDGNRGYALANLLGVVTADVLDWTCAWADPSSDDPAARGFPRLDEEDAVVVPELAARIAELGADLELSEDQLEHRFRAAYVYVKGHSRAGALLGELRAAAPFEVAWRCLSMALAAQGLPSSRTGDEPGTVSLS